MVEKTKPGTIHVLAECLRCNKAWDDHKTAIAKARSHAETTGHTVRVERAQTWTYNPRR